MKTRNDAYVLKPATAAAEKTSVAGRSAASAQAVGFEARPPSGQLPTRLSAGPLPACLDSDDRH